MTFEDVQQLVTTNDLRSIEALLPLLPDNYRSEYTVLHSTLSLQGATYQNPRVLMTGSHGTLIIAFNGDPNAYGDPVHSPNAVQHAYTRLELVQFRDATKSFEYREIDFSDPSQPAIISQANPSACLGCHGGSDPRPNWEAYDIWPGTYGSFDDVDPRKAGNNIGQFDQERPVGDSDAAAVQAEGDGLVTFLSAYAGHPRYRYLLGVPDAYAESGFGQEMPGHRNTLVTNRVFSRNVERIVRIYQSGRIADTPAARARAADIYAHTKLLTAYLLACQLNIARVYPLAAKHLPVVVPRQQVLPAGLSNLLPIGYGMDMQCENDAPALRDNCTYGNYFGALGVDTADWPTSFFGLTNPTFGLKAFGTQLPEWLMLYSLDADDPDLTPYVTPTVSDCWQRESQDSPGSACQATINADLNVAASVTNACTALAAAAKAQLAGWTDPPATAAACIGDCNLDGRVTIDELVTGVAIALGAAPVNSCLALDRDVSDTATVDEVITAVNDALDGCPLPAVASNFTSADQVTVEILSDTGAPGATVHFPVVLTSNDRSAGLNLDVVYPTGVLTEPACTNADPAVIAQDVSSNPIASGDKRFVLTRLDGAPVIPDGMVLDCTAQVLSTACNGTYTVKVWRANTSDAAGNAQQVTVGNGQITVTGASCTANGGGCNQIGVGRRWGAGHLLVFAAMPVLLLLRRRTRARRALTAAVLICLLPSTAMGGGGGAGGTWTPAGDASTAGSTARSPDGAAAALRWHVADVTVIPAVRDYTITGRIFLTGAPFLRAGRFRIVVSKATLHGSGTLTDRSGKTVATLAGDVTADGFVASMAAETGERGTVRLAAPRGSRWIRQGFD